MVKIGLIGCGGWGRNHARTWQGLGVLETICDENPALLAALRTEFPGAKTCEKAEEVFRNPDIQAVVIATPSLTHARLATAALKAGKHVLVEKPMALQFEEGKALVDLAKKLNRILMVGHVLEYHPAIQKISELLSNGTLGKILTIQSSRLNFGKIRTEENSLWSFAPHDIAIILRLTGEMPKSISCHGGAHLNEGVADTTLTYLDFASNIQASIFVSWLHPFKEHKLVIVGSRQMAVFNDLLPWNQKLALFPHEISWREGRVPIATKAEPQYIALNEIEPLKAECEAFLQAIKNQSNPLTDGDSGLRVLKVLEGAEFSLRQKGLSPKPNFFVHSTAVLDEGAILGEGTQVWHFSHVMKGAEIGKKCILGQNVFISKNVKIGNNVKIQNNVSVYEGVVLEDNVFCGPSMVFTNVMNPRANIERKSEFRKTVVREGATLGANSTIVCGVEIGKYAFIGAGALVSRNVPDHALIVGIPGKIKGWVCRCNTKLVFEAAIGRCPNCKEEYARADEAPGLVRVTGLHSTSHSSGNYLPGINNSSDSGSPKSSDYGLT